MMLDDFRRRSDEELRASLNVAVKVHHNDRHLCRFVAPQESFFPLIDTNWALLHRLDYREAEIFLRNRAAKGFTGIMVVLLVQHGLFEYPDRQGNWMFQPKSNYLEREQVHREAMDNASGTYRPDITRPNPKFWQHVDRVVKLAADLGISIHFLPTWARWVNGGYWGRPILFDREVAKQYGLFLGERYPFHPWILGGDGNRYWNPDIKSLLQEGRSAEELEITDFGPVFEAMAEGLLQGVMSRDYRTFMTFHPAQPWLPRAPEALNSSEWPDSDWLCLDGCQTGHHDGWKDSDIKQEDSGASRAQSGASPLPMWLARSSYIPIRKMYNARTKRGRPRPCMDLEPHYEMIHPGFDWSVPYWNGDDIRNGAWQAVFAGACGYVYGCCSLIQFHNDQSKTHKPILPPCTAYTNWFLELDLPGVQYAAILRRVMLMLPNPESRIPDQTFIVSDTNEPLDGSPAGERLVGGMRGTGWAMVHLPYGGDVTIRLDRALPDARRWNAWWINPRDGGRLPPFRTGEGSVGNQCFEAPSGGDIRNDWLLYLDTISASLAWPACD